MKEEKGREGKEQKMGHLVQRFEMKEGNGRGRIKEKMDEWKRGVKMIENGAGRDI